jgi:hypothetical protein
MSEFQPGDRVIYIPQKRLATVVDSSTYDPYLGSITDHLSVHWDDVDAVGGASADNFEKIDETEEEVLEEIPKMVIEI